MAVEVVYRSSRDPERLFMDKAEADRYDKMLELAEAHMPRIGPAPGGPVAIEDVGDLQPRAAHGRRVRPPVSASPRRAARAGRAG